MMAESVQLRFIVLTRLRVLQLDVGNGGGQERDAIQKPWIQSAQLRKEERECPQGRVVEDSDERSPSTGGRIRHEGGGRRLTGVGWGMARLGLTSGGIFAPLCVCVRRDM